jgi:hypothetical protein
MRGLSQRFAGAVRDRGSLDGRSWKKLSQGKGTPSCSVVGFSPPASVRFLRIHQKGRKPGKYWSIHELTLLAPARER